MSLIQSSPTKKIGFLCLGNERIVVYNINRAHSAFNLYNTNQHSYARFVGANANHISPSIGKNGQFRVKCLSSQRSRSFRLCAYFKHKDVKLSSRRPTVEGSKSHPLPLPDTALFVTFVCFTGSTSLLSVLTG